MRLYKMQKIINYNGKIKQRFMIKNQVKVFYKFKKLRNKMIYSKKLNFQTILFKIKKNKTDNNFIIYFYKKNFKKFYKIFFTKISY